MLRHEFTADLSRQLGLVSDDSHQSLYAEYLHALQSEPRGAPYLTWEAWGFSIGLFDPSSLALLTRNFNQASFRCAACGQTCTGGRLKEQPVITCPGCGRNDQMELVPQAVGPSTSMAATLPGVRGDDQANFTLPPDLMITPPPPPLAPALPAPPAMPARTEAGAEIDRQIEEFDAAGVGETIYSEDAPARVLPDLPGLVRTLQANDGGAGVPQVAPTHVGGSGSMLPPRLPATGDTAVPDTQGDKPDTLIDIHADEVRGEVKARVGSAGDAISSAPAGSTVSSDDDFRRRQERLTAWFHEFRYEEVIPEAKALLTFDPRAMGVRHLLERAENSQEQMIQLEQQGYDARERGDFDTAEACVLKLQEFVPLGYGANVLGEIREEKKRMQALIAEVESLTTASRFDEALERLTALVKEYPNFTPLKTLRETFAATRPLKEELNAAMAMRDAEKIRAAAQKVQEIAPDDPTARNALAYLEQAATIDRHDRLIAEAEAALRKGRSAKAIELAGQARRIVPGSGRARAVLDAVERRSKTMRWILIAVSGGVAVVLLMVGVLVVLNQMRDSRRAEALAAEPGESRVDALTAYLTGYPDDDKAIAALAAATTEWRNTWLAGVRAEPQADRREQSLQRYLERWPDDADARTLLAAAEADLAEIEQRRRDRLALKVLLDRHRNDPAVRLQKLREYAEAHPENMEVHKEIELARMEASRAEFDAAVTAERNLIARYTLVTEWLDRLATERSEVWQPFRQHITDTLARTRTSLLQDAQSRGAKMGNRDDANAFLKLLEQLVTLDPDSFREPLTGLEAEAKTIIRQDDVADRLMEQANAMSNWFEADAVLLELRRFTQKVPRLTDFLKPGIERLTKLASQRPPEANGFTFLRQQQFTGPAGTVTLNVYRSDFLAGALRLPDVPEALADRLDEKAEYTRLDVEFTMLPPVGMQQATFMMGSPDGEPGHSINEQLHQVTLTRPYLIARTEVSQEVWAAVQRMTRNAGTADLPSNPSGFQSPQNPVERIRWSHADEFCQVAGLRLPTEAEWAFACRAGTKTPFSFGDSISSSQANFDGRKPWPGLPESDFASRTVPVGSLPANGYGLYEMHGNVMEWCNDWFGRFGSLADIDPIGPTRDVVARVLRGGHWRSAATNIRTAARTGTGPDSSANTVGFRPAASITHD